MSSPKPASADPRLVVDSLPFPVVGLGASAGGLAALRSFFQLMPSGSGMAFVVVLHLSPEHESHVDRLLQAVTEIPVSQVDGTVKIEPNHIYVIPPARELRMVDGQLVLGKERRRGEPPMAIDVFFQTLAAVHRHRAIAIVMSGTGSDGTVGIKSVKEHGGIALAQQPEEAEYDSMPRNAIGGGGVDFVLPLGEMPAKLLAIWENAREIQLPTFDEKLTAEDVAERTEQALRDVLTMLRTRLGHDFTQYKRATLLRRIERRLQVNQLRDIPTYRDFLRDRPGEANALLKDLLINVTSFFRDRDAFAAVEKTVVPQLFDRKGADDTVRVWVIGCATGEEVYSIAMLLCEHAEKLDDPPRLQLFATDIDEDALAHARTAVYPAAIAADVSRERLAKFFVEEPSGGYRVSKPLRELVMFATHNVIQDPPFSRVDLVCCRNLLIYLNRHVQAKAIELIHFALCADAFLWLGLSESIDESNAGFIVFDKAQRIYRQQPRSRVGVSIDALPMLAPAVAGVANLNPPGRRLVSYRDLHQGMLEHYAPPSLVVNEQYNVVHLSETAGRFLRFAGGDASLDLLKLVPSELRMELRRSLDDAMRTMKTEQLIRIPIERGPLQSIVNVRIHPVRDKASARTFALVIFEEVGEQRAPADADDRARSVADATGQVEAVLSDTRSELAAAAERFEVQNEELKASNEELQATNEELRATTEELETGKEELQSINEELTTVNQELKNKVDEATRINDDLQNFITSTDIAVMFVDRELRLMRFTPLARDLFNVIPSDIGRSLTDITHRLEDGNLTNDIGNVLRSLSVVERELRSTSGRWYIVRILPYRTLDDRISGAVLTFIDITRRRDAEQSVRRNAEWLRLVLESIKDYAIFTMDPGGRIKDWNSGAKAVFGYAADEIIGKPFEILFSAQDRASGAPDEELRRAREQGRSDDERWHLRRDGTTFYASGVVAPLFDAALFGYVKIARDLTEQQRKSTQRDEQLADERINRAAAEQANKLKDEFLATLSHELRNPLSLIMMQADLVMRSPEAQTSSRLLHAAQIIHQTVGTQARLVDDLLDVTRARTGKLAINQQLLPLPFIVADSIGAVQRDAEAKRIAVDVQLTSEPLIVVADTARLRQVTWNLLSNAIKFTPPSGRVVVRLAREDGNARLDVEDNGQGIAPEFLPHVFDWFRQGDARSTRRQGGMGIGLALVRQLVELQGGRVEVRSEGVGKGSRFTVWLPLHKPAVDVRTGTLDVVTPPMPASAPLDGLKILVIDDAPLTADSLHDLLELEGATVATAYSGSDAVELARAQHFDVIVSDIAMPDADGYMVLGMLRETELNRTTPAIAYTGYGRPEDIERAREAGFQQHLTKPLSVARLLEAVRAVADTSTRTDASH